MTTYKFKVGNFKCVSITDFERHMAVDMIFSNRSADERQQVLSEFIESGLPGALNILYIDTGDHHILVDSSIGGADSNLLSLLAEIDVQPEMIDRVIITHGHGDHVGGLLVMPAGDWVFPNAQYLINATEWAYWTDEATLQNMGERAALWHVLREKLAGEITLFEPGDEILPGIHAVDAQGHTPGMVGLLLESNGEQLLHIADTAHHPFQIKHPDWSPRFDSHPDIAAETRQRLFERAAAEKLLVLAYHFSKPGLGYVKGKNWEPLV